MNIIPLQQDEDTEVRKEIMQFAMVLEKKLRGYEKIMGSCYWKNDNPWDLFHRLLQEATGISDALITHRFRPQNRAEFLEKAASTTVYAMLIADMMHGLTESPPKKK